MCLAFGLRSDPQKFNMSKVTTDELTIRDGCQAFYYIFILPGLKASFTLSIIFHAIYGRFAPLSVRPLDVSPRAK